MIYDTNFLIAIQGRLQRFSRAEAIAWMKREDHGAAYIPRTVEIEFLAGFASDLAAAPHLRYFTVLPMSEPVLKEAVRVMRDLRGSGKGIGVADSIIAATALLYDLPLVTDNTRHFKRVADLDVRGYIG
ncbi:MAG: type II toxin-antitoxin system VapC family toxin [Verrucomicrobiota bacterium]